jgi:hypothetical protein
MPEARQKREAQERADRLRIFRKQLEELESQNILIRTEEQRSKLNPFLDGTVLSGIFVIVED